MPKPRRVKAANPFRAKSGTAMQRAARNRNFAIFRLKNAVALCKELGRVKALDTDAALTALKELLQDVRQWHEG